MKAYDVKLHLELGQRFRFQIEMSVTSPVMLIQVLVLVGYYLNNFAG